MSTRFGVIWNLLRHYKYLIVIVIGVTVVGFVDENSLMKLVRYNLQISDLQDQIQKYNAQHEADSKKLKELRQNPKAIEKIARERYFMKAADEDIYVLSDDEKTTEKKDETTE